MTIRQLIQHKYYTNLYIINRNNYTFMTMPEPRLRILTHYKIIIYLYPKLCGTTRLKILHISELEKPSFLTVNNHMLWLLVAIGPCRLETIIYQKKSSI